MHTPLCGHASGRPMDYVRHAAKVGVGRITFTCHMPIDLPGMGGPSIRMPEADFPYYLEMVEDARRSGAELGVNVLTGIEAEYFPVEVIQARIARFLEENDFDFVLGSVHHQLPAYREWLAKQGLFSDAEIIEAYFGHLAQAAESGLYDSLSHPDVIRLYGTIGSLMEPEVYESAIRAAIDAAISADVCWEINTSGFLKGERLPHPHPVIRSWATQSGVKWTIGSDSHMAKSVGQHFGSVISAIKEEGADNLHYFEKRQRIAVPLDSLLD